MLIEKPFDMCFFGCLIGWASASGNALQELGKSSLEALPTKEINKIFNDISVTSFVTGSTFSMGTYLRSVHLKPYDTYENTLTILLSAITSVALTCIIAPTVSQSYYRSDLNISKAAEYSMYAAAGIVVFTFSELR